MMNYLFVGINVCNKSNVVRFTNSNGLNMCLFSIKNNQDVANVLFERILDTLPLHCHGIHFHIC